MRHVLRTTALLLAVPLLYLATAVVLGLIAVNRDFRPAREGQGVVIHLRTNGVHAELVLPARSPHDWSREFPVETIVDAQRATSLESPDWIAFGWGDRAFYLETPTWRELRPMTAFNAAAGLGTGAMHVEYLARPRDYRNVRIVIDDRQYARLVEYVRAGFARDAQGSARKIAHPGYFATDAFFEGTGRYTFWFTCNEWVRRALAQAGIRTAVWAPFDTALFWQLAT